MERVKETVSRREGSTIHFLCVVNLTLASGHVVKYPTTHRQSPASSFIVNK